VKPGPDTPALSAAQAAVARTQRPGRLSSRTLIMLRWLALAGQATALAVVAEGLKFQAPYVSCFLVIASGAWLNLLIALSPMSRRVTRDWEAAAQLAFDLIQLSALLYLTGGVSNPFALLILAPVTLAGASLRGGLRRRRRRGDLAGGDLAFDRNPIEGAAAGGRRGPFDPQPALPPVQPIGKLHI